MTVNEEAEQVDELIATPDLAGALESEQFRRFLDQIPVAIAVSELRGQECIVYANPEFEKLSGQSAANFEGKPWSILPGHGDGEHAGLLLGTAVVEASDCVGTFCIERADRDHVVVDTYSNIIQDDDGIPAFRLVALVDVTAHGQAQREELENRIREKDTLLREVQHRVKNNLQMITALIRLEARNVPEGSATARFDRLAGRIEFLATPLSVAVGGRGGAGQRDRSRHLSESGRLGCDALACG